MTAFWHWFVAAGTLIFVVWCVWLVRWSSQQGPQNTSDAEVVGHVWDGDLEEWNNPAPRWWLILYFLTIAWAVGYLVAYPGLGNYEGLLGWSQQGQYEEEMQLAAERYDPIYAGFAAMDFADLQNEPDAMQLGASLYASYCTTCHGSDARGAIGYPNLTDNDWLWGNSEAALISSIQNGRNAVMPVLSPALGGESGITNMVTYVRSLSGLVEADSEALSAQPMYMALCSSCHTADGSGNTVFGAPNLTDDIWLYGSSEQAVHESITQGRMGVMPAHGGLLGEHRSKILAAYIASLSKR